MTQRDFALQKCLSIASQRAAVGEIISLFLERSRDPDHVDFVLDTFEPLLEKYYLDLSVALDELRSASDQEFSPSDISKLLKKFM